MLLYSLLLPSVRETCSPAAQTPAPGHPSPLPSHLPPQLHLPIYIPSEAVVEYTRSDQKLVRLMSEPDILRCDMHIRDLSLNVSNVPHVRPQILVPRFKVHMVVLGVIPNTHKSRVQSESRKWAVQRGSAR